MKTWMCAPLFVWSLLLGCDACHPEYTWDDKDVDFLISRLENSWRVNARALAAWHLKDKIHQRDKVIAALTRALRTDTHEQVRSFAAQALGKMNPPAAETVPQLVEALYLPKKDRGRPLSGLMPETPPLFNAAQKALESISTPEALKALEEWKGLGPKLIESSVPDGASGVDADFINEHGITLRFRGNRSGSCHMLTADGKIIWRKSFEKNAVTFKPRPEDRKLIDGTVYTVSVRVEDDSARFLKTTITFTTKP